MRVLKLLLPLIFYPGLASAQSADKETTYVSLTALQAYYKEPGASFNNSMLGVTLGKNFSENLAVELLGAGSVANASFWVGSAYVTAQIQSVYGAFAKLRTTPKNGFSAYGRLGVSHGTLTYTARGTWSRTAGWMSGTDVSYGVGIEFDLSKTSFLQLDYTSYYNKGSQTVSAPSISIGMRF